MSSIKEQVEVDIRRFFEQIESQHFNDQIQTLRNLLDKYLHLSTSDHMMDYYDFNSIVGAAKNKFASESFDKHLQAGLTKRKIMPAEIPNILLIEATVAHLNKIECLKKLPKFDYKLDQYE